MSKSSLRYAGAGLAALLFAVAAITPSAGQSSDPSGSKAKSKQATTTSRTPSKTAKPLARQVSAAAPERRWTIEDALPAHSSIARRYNYEPQQPTLGRVPLQSGTVGVETETKTNAYKTPDGRTIPGFEATETKSSSYVGLSLQMPTSNNAINLPVPLEPLWGRP